jgi:hypothetical protein
MIVFFDQLPENSRVWIYPADRVFTKPEVEAIKNKTNFFLDKWTAHGAELQAAVNIPFDRFIVLGLNESVQSASGCSIDASVHFIQSLEQEFGLILLDKMNVTYRYNNTIKHIPLKEFRTMAKKKQLDPSVIVFNNLVMNKMEYDSHWEGPASSSWHARYF